MTNEKPHCWCGKELVSNTEFDEFDAFFGGNLYTLEWVCPDKRWHNRHKSYFITHFNTLYGSVRKLRFTKEKLEAMGVKL